MCEYIRKTGYHVPTVVVPNVFVWLNSLVEKAYKMVVPRLGRDFAYENNRMKEVRRGRCVTGVAYPICFLRASDFIFVRRAAPGVEVGAN